jgi:predicted acetyltransferase
MYRVVNLRELLGALGPGFGFQPCKLKIGVQDSFLPENDGDVVVHFDGGAPAVREDGDHEVAIRLDVAELSSLLMGVVGFHKLCNYGLAQISDPSYTETITRLFRTEDKPLCMTWF